VTRVRRTLGLVFVTVALAIAGVVLFRIAGRCDPTADGTAAEVPWDPDVEGYDADRTADAPPPSFAAQIAPVLARYCADCHSPARAKGGFSLPAHPDETAAVADRVVWQRVAEAVRSGRMPPPGKPRPTPAEFDAFTAWLDHVTAGSHNPGRVTLRRLNRAEYNNTIRDLVGVAFAPAADFPADDTGDGFDTIGDVLSVSPTLIEKYLTAAEAAIDAVAADPQLWNRLLTAPTEDYVPFVLRGAPPLRDMAIKGTLPAPADEQAAAIERTYFALQAFADRAYRRPVTQAEMSRLMRFVEDTVNAGERADAGLKLALKAVLVSPHFLFKVELDRPADPRLTDFELATRLSYFLWSSMPDEELFRLAAGGELHDPRTLVAQVRRMLQDSRSRALAENFAGQWLQTRALAEVTRDPARFPGFNADLVQAMRTETELFFDHVVREDRGVTELLTADSTFANERLARHYGIAGVSGDQFRRVSLAGTGRAGVLTHASVLTVTAGPTRTSATKRGKWVLENVLGTPAPTPPPGVDNLKDDPGGRPATLREQLDRHRARSECASCHARLDPLGFGLENFDAVGAWRDREGDAPVDASGTLPDGRGFRDPGELIAALAERPNDFARCLAQKLLTYGLGRSLEPADRSAVDRIVRHAARNGYRFSSLVIALVRSDPFQLRGVRPEEPR
jgi:mono/diheme cytochrome c family protein